MCEILGKCYSDVFFSSYFCACWKLKASKIYEILVLLYYKFYLSYINNDKFKFNSELERRTENNSNFLKTISKVINCQKPSDKFWWFL